MLEGVLNVQEGGQLLSTYQCINSNRILLNCLQAISVAVQSHA
jgi:hypothetical protein